MGRLYHGSGTGRSQCIRRRPPHAGEQAARFTARAPSAETLRRTLRTILSRTILSRTAMRAETNRTDSWCSKQVRLSTSLAKKLLAVCGLSRTTRRHPIAKTRKKASCSNLALLRTFRKSKNVSNQPHTSAYVGDWARNWSAPNPSLLRCTKSRMAHPQCRGKLGLTVWRRPVFPGRGDRTAPLDRRKSGC
jgi:hypothetical protein